MKNYLICLPILALLAWIGCKCDDPTNPECKNYDPCLSQTPVSAAFEMREVLYDEDWTVEVRNGLLLTINPLILIARDTQEVIHQWIIGTDPRVRDGQREVVTFGGYVGELTITHIVSGPPRSGCFPADDGRDTVVRTLTVIPFSTDSPPYTIDSDLPIYGTWRGFHTHQPDKVFDITIYLDPPSSPVGRKRVEIINLPDGCPGLVDVRPGANGLLISGGGVIDYDACWGTFAGLGQISVNGDTLIMPHRYSDPDSLALNPQKFIKRATIFIGIKQ